MNTSAYDETSGSDTREPRPMMEQLLVFDLLAEIDQLKAEPEWEDGDRNSRMLAKDVDFRVLLTALKPGATIQEKDGDSRVSVQVIEGTVAARMRTATTEVTAGQLAAIDAGMPWTIEALDESVVLLTLAWPREKATGA